MDSERWNRIQTLFHAAVELPEAERRAWLERECGDDTALLAQVMVMLDEDARGASVLDVELGAVAGRVLDGRVPKGLLDQRFGPYRIESVLGEGGMGTVYLARRDDLGSTAAVKILRDASLSPSRRERFAAEQRTLAQLSHPAIAALYDADTLPDGTPWFVMEYVEGEPLTDYCRRHDATLRGRLLLFRSVCEAVLHAHQHAVIHRDLKPSNVLVTADGKVKLLDFGIAKQLESLDDAADQTRTGLRLMTPAYAAPEQLRGGRIGTHTDVYALGVVLYELLTGRLPFDLGERSAGEIEAILAGGDVPRPSVAARGPAGPAAVRATSRAAWADLDVLCLTAMHRDPARRYGTVDALLRDIDHFLDGEPLDARPDAMGYRLGKFVRRNRPAVLAGAAALAILIGTVTFYTIRLASARNAAVAEANRTQRIQRFMLSLFQGGEEEVGPADSLRVLTLIDRGLQEARSLDREPVVQAALYETLGGIYQQLGDLPRADSLLVTALDRRRALFGDDHAEVGRSLVALGLLRVDQAEYEEAENLIRDGLDLSRLRRRPDHPDIVAGINALGRVLEERGRYDSAIVVLEDAVRRQEPAGESAELAASLYGLANNHFYAGHYEAADSLTRRVLEMSRRLNGHRHPSVAEDLINLGAIQHEQGHYAEAERYYRDALDITQGWYGETHPRTAANLTVLARTLLFTPDRNAEAVALLRRALAIQERVFGPVHPRVASTLNELGRVALGQDRPDEAAAYWTRMLAIYRDVYAGQNHYLVGIPLSNLASAAHAKRDFRLSERYMRDALDIFRATLPAGHSNIGIGHLKLGRALLRQRRFGEAEAELLAGYQLLKPQMDNSSVWLQNARADLADSYDGLGRPDDAARFRAEREHAAAPAKTN